MGLISRVSSRTYRAFRPTKRRTSELCKRTRYHKESNLRARSLIYDNITKSRDYYFTWSHKVLQPQQFPWKPLHWTNRVYQRNLFSEKNSSQNKPGIPRKYRVGQLDPSLVEDEILTPEEFDVLENSEFVNHKLMAYAPYHAYKHPDRELAGYEGIKELVIKDYKDKTGQDLPEKYVQKLEQMISYEYASKEKKAASPFQRFDGLDFNKSTKSQTLRPNARQSHPKSGLPNIEN